ncbi:ABC transporter substrate-binding protein [Labrys wisconsinensis]|uniref:Peptide/nickel transport system substrate-binding protein n=1 Tax=Labrys wisconsinensis TaxID=425677 RepID=A0ABU0JB68_9HYPH|nr:ABC transporter substrate-binding protein [Labrys wisconsinensis]MDQ0470850.1 peptide/nickel transport system substrate-binding protein [Labrys wisconsinensis]
MADTESASGLAGLTANALSGRIGRRDFMQGALALGLGLGAASALWAREVAAATPAKGGTFRVGLDDGNTSDALDPATTNSRFMITLAHTRTNFLTEIAGDNTVTGELAESFEGSKDARTWTLKLRKGVEFHHGKTFDARDAAASLNLHRGADSKSAAKPLLAAIEEIVVDDDHTLVLKLNQGNADIPYILTDYHLIMLPLGKDGKIDPMDNAGTGGYVLETFQPGVRATMKRFANYWKPDRAHFDSVVFTAVNDYVARQTALLSTELDAIIECDYKTVDLLAKAPDIEVDEVPSGTHVGMPMLCDAKPFDNPDLRLALKYATDREQLMRLVLKGHGSIGNDHPISPIMPFFDASQPQRHYDPDRARSLIRKAGLDGLTIQLSAADTVIAGAVDMAALFAETVKKIGVNVEVKREPNDSYWSNVWLKKPFCMAGWGQRPTPDIIFSLGYAAGADWNESHFKNERFNKLLVEARAEIDARRRTDMYGEMQRLVSDEGGTIIPFFRNWVYARHSKVAHGPKLSASWPLDGARGAERWWFA